MRRRRFRPKPRFYMILLALAVIFSVLLYRPGQPAAADPPPPAAQSAQNLANPRVLDTWTTATSLPIPPIQEPDGILMVYGQPKPLWALHPYQEGPVGSTTKLMTAYLVQASLPMNQVVTISDNAAATGGSEMFMQPGSQFTVHQLLVGMILRSANDAAVALSEAAAGHESRFVALMNATARHLGLDHTQYADPDGISPGSESSAIDLAHLAELDLNSPILAPIFVTRQTSLPENPIVTNINGMVWRDPYSLGLKTGWTSESMGCVVFASKRMVDGVPVTLVGVVLHGPSFPVAYQDSQNLLSWGFSAIAPTVTRWVDHHDVPAHLNPSPIVPFPGAAAPSSGT
jgi:D-alanyl-D-alanine carboxypeptidase (penicillin-binding protein 5/6)